MAVRPLFALASIVAFAALAIAVAGSASAASASVTIRSFTFMPDAVTVNVGETVTWTNLDGGPSHSATSTTGEFDTDVFTSGSRTVTFERAGVFPYICKVHQFMQGRVTVAGPATPAPKPPAPPTAPPQPAPTQAPRPSPAPPLTPGGAPTGVPQSGPVMPPASPAEAAASPAPVPTGTPSASPVAFVPSPSPTGTQAVAVSAPSGTSRTGEGLPGPILFAWGAVLALTGWAVWRIARRA